MNNFYNPGTSTGAKYYKDDPEAGFGANQIMTFYIFSTRILASTAMGVTGSPMATSGGATGSGAGGREGGGDPNGVAPTGPATVATVSSPATT